MGLTEPEASLRARAAQALGVDEGELRGFRIARRSLDARRGRAAIHYVCQLDLALDATRRPRALGRLERRGKLAPAPRPASLRPEEVAAHRRGARVVVVGSGPAGTFAALTLALGGAQVELIERGARLEERAKRLVPFHRGGPLDPETNLLFGEGGAGTYSDGKLATRVSDELELPILEELVACGAPREVLFDSRAHIGTDRLHRLLPRLRARLEEHGVRFHFETRLEGLVQDPGPPRRVRAARTTRGELSCDALVLAVGHSARDTWEVLAAEGLPVAAKPFQLGVRVEHPQELITRALYGRGPEAELLGPADYRLVSRAGGEAAGAHTFCMCPGGRIVASVNEPGRLCTNGMSNSRHSSRWASAAVVTTLTEGELSREEGGAFAGVALQRRLEERFFAAGGGTYAAPAQRAPDFLEGRASREVGRSSFTFGVVPERIDLLLPPRVRAAVARALVQFDRTLPGYAGAEGLLVGIESRSSSPVRIPRGRASRLAEGWENLLPVGEGAGYAGGIASAAIDGARSALVWLAGRGGV